MGLAVGVGPAEEDAAVVFQGQDAVVLQEDYAFARGFQRRLPVLCIPGETPFRGDGRHGLFKQAQGKLGGEDFPGGFVNPLFRDAAALYALQDRFEIVVSLHVHVNPGFHGNQEGFVFAGHQVVHAVQALDVHPVAHYKALKPHFLAQDILYQPLVGVAGNAVELVVGGHHRGHSGFFYGCFERRKVEFPHLAFAHVHGSCVEASGGFSAANQMLGAGQNLSIGEVTVPALQAPDFVFSHLGHQPGVFPEAFSHAAPAGVAGYVQVGRKSPVHAGLAHLLGRLGPNLLHQFRTEGRGQADVAGIHRAAHPQAVAVDGVYTQQQGNAQAGFGRHHLQLVRLFPGENVQECTHLAFPDALGQLGIAQVLVRCVNVLVRGTLVRRNIAGTHVLAHLADFFFQRHLLQQETGPLSGRQGGIPPVPGRTGGEAQEGSKEKGFFHYNCTVSVRVSLMEVSPAFTWRVLFSQLQSLTGVPFRLTFRGLEVQRSSKL